MIPRIVVMGVSGSGKSTLGAALAESLGVPFVDGDDLHPVSNVEKMRRGEPLTEDDRRPWLRVVAETLSAHSDGLVMACSALRRAYRDTIRAAAPGTVFVHSHGDPAIIADRMSGRPGHFMPPALLASQVATLEPLQPDEPGLVVDLTAPVDVNVRAVRAWCDAAHRN